jgi:hypothetical protein
MKRSRIGLLWYVAALLFFLAAILKTGNRAGNLVLGAVSLCLAMSFNRKK